MLIRIENLYINTDNIVTITNFEELSDGDTCYIAGITINGEKIVVYKGDNNGNPGPEQRIEILDKLAGLVQDIVNRMSGAGSLTQQVVEEVKFNKALTLSTTTELGIKKEQIND